MKRLMLAAVLLTVPSGTYAQPPPPRTSADIHADTLARNKARQRVRVAAGAAKAKAQAAAAYRQAQQEQAAYERMLPYLMEQQRQELQAMDQAQRNAALQRMARAAEVQAGASQSAAWWLWTRAR